MSPSGLSHVRLGGRGEWGAHQERSWLPAKSVFLPAKSLMTVSGTWGSSQKGVRQRRSPSLPSPGTPTWSRHSRSPAGTRCPGPHPLSGRKALCLEGFVSLMKYPGRTGKPSECGHFLPSQDPPGRPGDVPAQGYPPTPPPAGLRVAVQTCVTGSAWGWLDMESVPRTCALDRGCPRKQEGERPPSRLKPKPLQGCSPKKWETSKVSGEEPWCSAAGPGTWSGRRAGERAGAPAGSAPPVPQTARAKGGGPREPKTGARVPTSRAGQKGRVVLSAT